MTPPPTVALENARYDGDWYYCWLIERRDEPRPRWLGEYAWETDASKAIWYARKSDAEAARRHQLGGVPKIFVCEHGFMLATPKPVECGPKCATCGDTGGVDNYVDNYIESSEPCPSCQSKPVCETCDGDGFIPAMVGLHTPQAGVGEEPCPDCQPSVAEGERDSPFTRCTFEGPPPAPHKFWSDWAASDQYVDVKITACEFDRTAQPAAPSAIALSEEERSACESGSDLLMNEAAEERSRSGSYPVESSYFAKYDRRARLAAREADLLRVLAQRGR